MKNDKYDEAMDLSQSVDPVAMTAPSKIKLHGGYDDKDAKSLKKGNDQSKSQSVLNKPFDEALEFSRSGSEESIDTRASQKIKKHEQSAGDFKHAPNKNPTLAPQIEIKKSATQPQVLSFIGMID